MITFSTLAFFSITIGVYFALSFSLHRLFYLNKRKRRELTRPIHYVTYYCKKGHPVGFEEPLKGELCDTCIEEGAIKADLCPRDGTPLAILKRTPPYKLKCPKCGYTSERIEYKIGNKTVSLDEWIKYQKYDPIEIPRLRNKQPSAPREPDKTSLSELKDEWKQLYDKSLKYTKLLKQDRERRTALQKQGTRIGIIIWIGLLLLAVFIQFIHNSSYQPPILIYGNNNIASTDRFTVLLKQFQATLLTLFVSAMAVAALFTAVIVILRRRKQAGQTIDWHEFMGSAGLAIFAELLIYRVLSTTQPTIYEVLLILMLEIVPAFVFSLIYNRRYLNQTVKLLQEQNRIRRWIRKLFSSIPSFFVIAQALSQNLGQTNKTVTPV